MRGGGIARGALGALVLTMAMWSAAPFALAGGGGCFHLVAAGVGTGTEVDIADYCFGPLVLYVDPGATVTWANQDPLNHVVFGVGGGWGSQDEIRGGEKVSYTFKDSGTFVYVCTLHYGMAGAVVVGDGRGAAGFDPTSVTKAALVAVPSAASAGPDGGVSMGTAVGLMGLGLAGAAGLWVIRTDHRRRTVPVG